MKMENFWDFNTWGTLLVIGSLLLSLLAANALKRAFPIIQVSLVPTSVLGGLILTVIAGIYKLITGDVMYNTVIFGGHNVLRDFGTFDECPEVDILIYREGEEAFRQILLCLLEDSDLSEVANIAFKKDGEYVKTREEGFCMSEYPSPYLSGIFDSIADGKTNFSAILETNRGCPFKCSFCDWGTLGSKVRLFPMERIKAEMDWIADHGIEYVYCADGNFGLFDRDEEIAEYIIELKKKTGFPTLIPQRSKRKLKKSVRNI